MEAVIEKSKFQSLSEKVGQFYLRGKTFVIPEMNRNCAYLVAAVFRSFGISAVVMETYQALELGMEYSSGKECYPCQVTMGDILYFLKKEQARLQGAFDPEDYIYFMPEASGPCRFGMYNKYQRIVLDSFPDLKEVKIGALTTKDGYSLHGLIEEQNVQKLKKAAYIAIIMGDILDRLLWRTRPYEKKPDLADAFVENAMQTLSSSFERHSRDLNFKALLDDLEAVVADARHLIDPSLAPRPLIGMVGEIYLRSHVQSNQHIIKVLEKHGAEVVNASIGEWMNYITYDGLRKTRAELLLNLKQFRLGPLRRQLKELIRYGGELFYQEYRQKQVFQRAHRRLDLAPDHRIAHLEAALNKSDFFSFEVGTEACLSIAGILEYMHAGFNGVVNVYPFTCMPSTITSAVVKPLMSEYHMPYLDTPYDSSFQPGREAAIRTFMYQAHQHLERHGRKHFATG